MPLFDEELLLLRPSPTKVRGGHAGLIQPRELAGVPFLLYPTRSNIRMVIDQFFRELDLVPNVLWKPRHGGDQTIGGVRLWLFDFCRNMPCEEVAFSTRCASRDIA